VNGLLLDVVHGDVVHNDGVHKVAFEHKKQSVSVEQFLSRNSRCCMAKAPALGLGFTSQYREVTGLPDVV